jgi:hypothetical protein
MSTDSTRERSFAFPPAKSETARAPICTVARQHDLDHEAAPNGGDARLVYL